MRSFLIAVMSVVAVILSVSESCAGRGVILYAGTYYDQLQPGLLQSVIQSPGEGCLVNDAFGEHVVSILKERNAKAARPWNIISDEKTIHSDDQVVNLAFIISRASDFTQDIDKYSKYHFSVGLTLILYSAAADHDEKIDLYYTRFQLARKFEARESCNPLSNEQRKECLIESLDKAIAEAIDKSIEEYNPTTLGLDAPKSIANGTGAKYQVDKFVLAKSCGFTDAFNDENYQKQFIQWVHDGISDSKKVNLLPPFKLLGKNELSLLVNTITRKTKEATTFDESRDSTQKSRDKIVASLMKNSCQPDYFIRAVFTKGDVSTIKEIENRRSNLYMAFIMGGVVKSDNLNKLLITVKDDEHVQESRFNGLAYDEEDNQFMLNAVQKTAINLGRKLADAIATANLSM